MSDEKQLPAFIADIKGELTGIIDAHEEKEKTRKLGPPSKMCYERIVAVLTRVATGAPMTAALAGAGISRPCWKDWCEAYPKLEEFIQRADAEYVNRSVQMIADGTDIKGNPDWKATAWLLERRKRDDFAAPKQVEINNNITNNSLSISLDQAAVAQLQDAHKLAAGAIAAQRQTPALPAIEAELVPG